MNDSTWLTRRPPSASARTATAVVATVALVLLAAACGTTPSPTGSGGSSNGGGTTNFRLVAFANCMRSAGVPNFPDPNSSGGFPKKTPGQLGVTPSRYQSANHSCQHLLPNGGSGPNQAELQQIRTQGLRFAQCMRSHRVPLPDPGSDGRIADPASIGIDQGSALFQAANQACGKYRPAYMPSNAEYNAYVQANG